jgi:hypothetical protein
MNPDYPEFDYMEMIWQIRQVISEPDPDYLLKIFPLQNKGIIAKFAKPHQETLLHRLIQVECEIALRTLLDNYGLDKLQEYLEHYLKPTLEPEGTKQILLAWRKRLYTDDERTRLFLEGEILPSLLPLSPLIDQLFFVLFTDRLFLFQFNDVLSKIVCLLKDLDFSEYLTIDGRIKRLSYLPKWLEKGIFKRDQGHCVQCDKDLTGARTIEEAHYDHIMALAEYGSNDPANFQLFCKGCNLKKGKKKWLPPESILRFW